MAEAPAEPVVRIDPEIADMIPGFLANRKRDVERLRDALGRADLEAVRGIGHTLKGVGGGYGFPRISEIGAVIEEAAERGDACACEPAVAELSHYLARVRVEPA